MTTLTEIAPRFVEMAHRIVWASVATVGEGQVPRSRVLHPIWEWDGTTLVGFIATGPTPLKRAHLANAPRASVNYWHPNQDTCTAECKAELLYDRPTRRRVWDLFANAPEPVGYDPKIIPVWTSPDVDAFAVMRLEPWHLRTLVGASMLAGKPDVLTWTKRG